MKCGILVACIRENKKKEGNNVKFLTTNSKIGSTFLKTNYIYLHLISKHKINLNQVLLINNDHTTLYIKPITCVNIR